MKTVSVFPFSLCAAFMVTPPASTVLPTVTFLLCLCRFHCNLHPPLYLSFDLQHKQEILPRLEEGGRKKREEKEVQALESDNEKKMENN